VLPDEFWARMDTIKIRPDVTETSSLGRLHFWEVGWDMALDHPVFGIGHNSYNFAYDRYDSSRGKFGIKRSVHSQWFGVLSELGFVGLFLFVANIVLALIACGRARRLAKRGQIPRELGELAIGVESALVVMCVGGSFVIFQYIEMLWHSIGLSIAINFVVNEQLAAQQQPVVVPALPEPVALRATS
jgi:O-antigen ligase